MTVGELKDILNEMNEDSEIRLAMQPSWPFEYSIGDVIPVGDNPEEEIIYFTEGNQLRYLPQEAKEQIGW